MPNELTKTDDQVARARGLSEAGLGAFALETDELREKISLLSDRNERTRIQTRMAEVNGGKGAQQAALLFASLASRQPAEHD